MRDPLGTIVFAQMRPGVMIGFINQLAMRIRIDGERTGIDTLANAQLLHQFQDVARALDIDLLTLAFVLDPNFIPAGNVENAIRTTHRLAHALPVGDIALLDVHTERTEIFSFGGSAHHRHDLVPRLDKLTDHTPTDKTSRACDKVFHGPLTYFLFLRAHPAHATAPYVAIHATRHAG